MTSFFFFDTELFVIYSAIGHVGLVLASGATSALCLLVRQVPWGRLGPRPLAHAKRVGALVGGAVAVLLAAGLRVRGTAYDPAASPMLWEWLTALGAAAGVVITAWGGAGALAGVLLSRAKEESPQATPLPRDEIEAALIAFETLKAGTARLRLSEQEATRRTQDVADSVAAAEYGKAADAIRNRLQLAEELQTTAGTAVLRLACAEPVRLLLERRPDAVLARLNDPAETTPLNVRVQSTLVSVRGFMGEIERTRRQLQAELTCAQGSVAQRVGLDAAERARPFEAAVSQLEVTYGRVGHRLEALRLHLGAEADAGTVAGAALALTSGSQPTPAQDVVAIAVEMSRAEQSAVTALAALGARPSRIAEVVVNASASLARDSGDDEALADVLRSVRRELER